MALVGFRIDKGISELKNLVFIRERKLETKQACKVEVLEALADNKIFCLKTRQLFF